MREIDPRNVEWSDVNEAIERVDCRHLADRLGVDIEDRSGDTWRAYCPAHHDPPGAAFDVSAKAFKCWSCEFEVGGNRAAPMALYNELAGLGCDLDDPQQRDVVKVQLAEELGVNPSTGEGEPSVETTTPDTPTPTPHQGHEASAGLSAPSEARRKVLGDIWRITEPMGLTDPARDWLTSRGIRPMIAQAYGWRDWGKKIDEIRATLREYTAGELIQAGLLKPNGSAWYPLGAMMEGNEDERGLAVPIWHPEYNVPVAYAWRTYSDRAYTKVYQQPSKHLDFDPPPLVGLREPSPEMHVMMAQHDQGWLYRNVDVETAREWIGTAEGSWPPDTTPRPMGTYPGPWIAIVCEGETDMLSVADAALELHTPYRIVPVALTRKAQPLPPDALDLLAQARGVHMALDSNEDKARVDEDDEDKPPWFERGNEIVDALSPQRFRYSLHDESNDLTDLHHNGRLTNKLQDWIEDLT
jgi:hypothetical protein